MQKNNHASFRTLAAPGDKMLYWAYGSNLSISNMRRRCRDAQPLEPLIITRAQLIFRSVADVEARSHSKYKVPGGLWRITQEDREQLDRYEGVASGLYRRCYLRLRIDGREQLALYYKMQESGVAPPSASYLDVIASGYRDFGLDDYIPYLDRAVRRSWDKKRVTPYIRRRRERDGHPELARSAEG